MSPRTIIRLLVAVMMLMPAIPAATLAQTEGEVIVASDNFDDPSVGMLQEGSDNPDLRYDYDDDGYEIDAFADDFSGDLTVPVPGEYPNGTIQIEAALTGRNDGNCHYLFLSCRVRDETGYKLEIRPLAQVAAIWLLSPDGNQRIASAGLEGDPGSGPFTIAFSCLGNELTGFIAAVAQSWARGLTIDCGCFGGGGQVEPGQTAYPQEIATDVGFLALAAWLIIRPSTPFSADGWLRRGRTTEATEENDNTRKDASGRSGTDGEETTPATVGGEE